MHELHISKAGEVLGKHRLLLPRMTVGRRPGNHIVLEGIAVSGEHAAFTQAGATVTVEDLGSTNGVWIGRTRVQRHELSAGADIRIGEYTLKLVSTRADSYEPTLLVRRGAGTTRAAFRHLDGTATAATLELNKIVTTIGKPGSCVLACIRRGNDFALKFVGGTEAARLNGQLVTTVPSVLKHHDVLEIAGSRLQFVVTPAPQHA